MVEGYLILSHAASIPPYDPPNAITGDQVVEVEVEVEEVEEVEVMEEEAVAAVSVAVVMVGAE
jgi:hypothetical protein